MKSHICTSARPTANKCLIEASVSGRIWHPDVRSLCWGLSFNYRALKCQFWATRSSHCWHRGAWSSREKINRGEESSPLCSLPAEPKSCLGHPGQIWPMCGGIPNNPTADPNKKTNGGLGRSPPSHSLMLPPPHSPTPTLDANGSRLTLHTGQWMLFLIFES